MEIENYTGSDCSAEFCEEYGTRDCSAWGIAEAGCLGLLVNHGLSSFETIYVHGIQLNI
ncbi:hypothetical protein F5Y06DRAFT_270617 [Hypoxylon sp. FL0890]|nr:hypothetical protein F5Y06DRAFT_270617 [Hypoxylon sp. FL0890]